MMHKKVLFEYERCLKISEQAKKICKAMLSEGVAVFIVTNLPKEEFYSEICDYALDNNIFHRNIIFNNGDDKKDLLHTDKFKLYFTANEFEVNYLNEKFGIPIACHIK